MREILARYLIFLGLFFILIGGFLLIFQSIFNLEKLPGDIIIKKRNFTFYFPLGTCLLFSLLLTFTFWILNKLF